MGNITKSDTCSLSRKNINKIFLWDRRANLFSKCRKEILDIFVCCVLFKHQSKLVHERLTLLDFEFKAGSFTHALQLLGYVLFI